MHKVNDLIEDREGDKAVVTATDHAGFGLVKVRYDCTGMESNWLRGALFTNLSERVRELDA